MRIPELTARPARCSTRSERVAATSANLPGEPDPRRLEDVPSGSETGCAAEIDGGELPGTPSTVIDLTGPSRS